MPDEPLTRELNAALTIEIKIDSACTIKATGNGDPVICHNTDFDRTKLATLRRQSKQALRELSDDLRGKAAQSEPIVPIPNSIKALTKLQKFGYDLLLALVGKSHRETVPLLVDLAIKSIYGAGVTTPEPILRWDAVNKEPPLIVFKTSVNDGIPIDTIPLLNLYTHPRPVKDLNVLGRFANSFLGFCGIVKREISDTLGPCRYLENDPNLPIKMFINRGLSGSRKEERTFRKNDRVHVGRAWPEDSATSQDDFAETLANHLWEVETRFGGPRRKHPDQVCHFSCHSHTGIERLPNDYEISLQSDFLGGRRTASLRNLTIALSALSEQAKDDKNHRPLIFMNSCGSGDLDPSGASSFPNLFMNSNLGFTGFIGTETSMPNDLASEFSIRFYDKVILGMPIGKALLQTRWDVLSKYHNPLGLLYALFAEPEIRVRWKASLPAAPSPSLGAMAGFIAGLKNMFRPAA